MASTVLILAITQSALGDLHHLLGALLAANMAGLAFAAWGARLRIRLWAALGLGLAVPAFSAASLARFDACAGSRDDGRLLFSSLAAGAAVGIAFRAGLDKGTTPAAIYVVDLLGAALLRRWSLRFALPGVGLDAACALVALLAAPAALALGITRH